MLEQRAAPDEAALTCSVRTALRYDRLLQGSRQAVVLRRKPNAVLPQIWQMAENIYDVEDSRGGGA